ncbi:MAG: glucoamylase family protein [Chitinophagaceae bacterium]
MKREEIINALGSDQKMLTQLQYETLSYFLNMADEQTGLIADKNEPGSPASIAATGLGLSCFVTAVSSGMMPRENALESCLKIIRFFAESEQSKAVDATGYKGFYYHFLDMKSGRRVWKCELSTIDSAILIAGILSASLFFNNDKKEEKELRELAELLCNRVDWKWATARKESLCHGWKPETGFLKTRWDRHYSEAHIAYILALGSPTHPIPAACYQAWISTFEWMQLYDTEYIYAGPLFVHQMSQLWLDFSGIRDAQNEKWNLDYFENSRRATCVQRRYAMDNPHEWEGYSEYDWGFTASDGPGPKRRMIKGKSRNFYAYKERGVPFGPDDGTISPWSVVASLPFAPDIVLESLRHFIEHLALKREGNWGLDSSYNPSFHTKDKKIAGWISSLQFGLNQGPIILMIENFRTKFLWKLMKHSPQITSGLKRAGFKGGWIDEHF